MWQLEDNNSVKADFQDNFLFIYSENLLQGQIIVISNYWKGESAFTLLLCTHVL